MPAGIIIPADAARLLPGEVAAGIPGVSVPASLEAALDEMEAVLLSQARTSGAFDASDGPQATVSAAGTTGPGAALIATCGPGTTQRLRGILESGRALGAAAILLGPWQPGVTCQVAADGMVTDVMPSGAGLEGIRLFNLGAAEAAAITAVLRDARGTPPAAPALARPATATASPPSRRAADVPREPRPAAGSYLPAPAMPAPPAPARAAQHHAGTSTPRCGHSRCGHPRPGGRRDSRRRRRGRDAGYRPAGPADHARAAADHRSWPGNRRRAAQGPRADDIPGRAPRRGQRRSHQRGPVAPIRHQPRQLASATSPCARPGECSAPRPAWPPRCGSPMPPVATALIPA